MALTALAVALTDGAPHVVGSVALTTGAGNGLAITVSGNRTRPITIQLTGDADWGWHQTDSTAYANTQHTQAGAAYTMKLGNGTFNFYMLVGTGTGTVVVTAVEND